MLMSFSSTPMNQFASPRKYWLYPGRWIFSYKRWADTNGLIINFDITKELVLHRQGMVGLLIAKLRMVSCWVCEWKKLKSVNIWQSYKQDRDCLEHFLPLLAVCWPGAQSSWDNHSLACNFAKYSPILNFFFTLTLSNEPFLIWLLTTPPHLKYVATLPCNFSLMACFADINVSQGSVATHARCGGILIAF